MLKNKKGIALNQAFGAVLTLVLVGVLVIIGIIIFVNLGATFTDLATASATNESVTMTTGGPRSLGNASLCNVEDFTISLVINESSTVINSLNYTISDVGIINNLTSEFNTVWLVTSTSNWGGDSCVASDEMITQFGTYPVLVGLVGTIIFLGLVIGVLVASFVFGGKGGI